MLPPLPKSLALISKLLASFTPKKVKENIPQRIVGLNIGRENIVATEVSSMADQLTLEHCVRHSIIKDKPIGQQVKELFQEMKLETKEVCMSLKGQGVVVRYLTFPRMNRADFASSIQFEAEKYLPFNLNEIVLDYHILEDGSSADKASAETMRVILVAARKTEVDRLSTIAQEGGLRLQIIDLDVFALVNAFYHATPEAKSKVLALVDLGAVDTSLAVLNKGRLVFSRDIAFGGNDCTETIRRKLSVPFEEALQVQHEQKLSDPAKVSMIEEALDRLFQELSSSLTYYYDQHQDAEPIESIYVSGGFSQVSVLPNLLEKHIQAPVKKWDPTAGFVLGGAAKEDVLKELIPYLPVSIGLAIRPR